MGFHTHSGRCIAVGVGIEDIWMRSRTYQTTNGWEVHIFMPVGGISFVLGIYPTLSEADENTVRFLELNNR